VLDLYTWNTPSGRDRLRRLAIAALALTAATSCGGARASRCEPTQASPAALPTPPDEARTTSLATAAMSETMQPWSDGTAETAPNRFVEKNGIRFAYRAFGRKPGVPLLLLASFRGTMDSWDPLLTDALAQARPVILFDNAGVGLSSGDAPTTVADTAKDAEAFAFEWQTWTPSFPLVRERVHRLAMRGAWTAARFGTPVVDRYLRVVMEGRQPLHCFDAVLGITAIALASPRDSSAIIRRVERALRSRIANATDANDRLIAEACLRSVHVAINEPSTAEDRTLLRGRRRASLAARDSKAAPREMALFLALDDEADCAEIDDDGLFPAILALPSITGASPELFFGTAATRPGGSDTTWTAARARAVLERSSGPMLCSCGSGRLAQECRAN
jgi:pimeloyl-ACP methyl ester carboxylesterase